MLLIEKVISIIICNRASAPFKVYCKGLTGLEDTHPAISSHSDPKREPAVES